MPPWRNRERYIRVVLLTVLLTTLYHNWCRLLNVVQSLDELPHILSARRLFIADRFASNITHERKVKFLEDWESVMKAEFDTSHVAKYCNMTWMSDEAVPWMVSNGRTDVDTSYIALWDIRPAGTFSRIILQSQFPNGTKKLFGGDYWRVFVRGVSSMPVLKTDMWNGSYEFKFLVLEAGKYYLDISLEYTCCKGMKEPPVTWFQKGNIQGKEQKQGILLKEVPYINKQLWRGNNISFYVPPAGRDMTSIHGNACRKTNGKCLMLFDGFGRWTNNSTWLPWCKSNAKLLPTVNKDGVLWILGDSVSKRFYSSIKKHDLCRKIFRLCFCTYVWVYKIGKYNLTVGYERVNSSIVKQTWDENGFNVSRVIEELKQALFHPAMNAKSVLVFNYGLHYTLATRFEEFKELIAKIIELRRDPRVRARMVWRTSTSLNRHKYSMPNLHSRRFMTSQRVQLYNAYATQTFCDAGFPILNVYPLTDSYPEGTGNSKFPYDPVHYEEHVMMPLADRMADAFSRK